MKKTYNFPYFGAGKIDSESDGENLMIAFKGSITEKQKKQIIKNIPPPLSEVIWLDKDLLNVIGDDGLHKDIVKTYTSEDGLDTESLKYYASTLQIEAFNEAIECWINEVHKISPILFTYRENNMEFGNFRGWRDYSDWHKWSLNQYKLILPYFTHTIENFYLESVKGKLFKQLTYMLEEVSDFYDNISITYYKFTFPGVIEFRAFLKGNVEPLENMSNKSYRRQAINMILYKAIERNEIHKLIKHVNVLLRFESEIYDYLYEDLQVMFFIHIENTNSELFKKTVNSITDKQKITKIVQKGYQLIQNRKYKEAAKLHEKLLKLPTDIPVRTGFYTNVLWVFQKDNTGLPINKKRNRLALKKSIPKGAEFPNIFFNACGVYVEMEEFDKAYEMVEKALAHHLDKKYILDAILNESMLKRFREETNVLNLLKNYKSEPKENPFPRIISESVAHDMFYVRDIYNQGFVVNFNLIILINGHVNIEDEFNNIYKKIIEDKNNPKKKILIIVNGNLIAKSINKLSNINILVMGKVDCKKTGNKNIIEKGKLFFDYVPLKGIKYNE